jgi:hypothetical protein
LVSLSGGLLLKSHIVLLINSSIWIWSGRKRLADVLRLFLTPFMWSRRAALGCRDGSPKRAWPDTRHAPLADRGRAAQDRRSHCRAPRTKQLEDRAGTEPRGSRAAFDVKIDRCRHEDATCATSRPSVNWPAILDRTGNLPATSKIILLQRSNQMRVERLFRKRLRSRV